MDEDLLQEMRDHAYLLWEQEGRPGGRVDEFRLSARREVRAAGDGPAQALGEKAEQDNSTAGSA